MILVHCVKGVQIRSFFWSVFSGIRTEYGEILRISPYSDRMPEKYGPEKAPYLDTFHAVKVIGLHCNSIEILIAASLDSLE